MSKWLFLLLTFSLLQKNYAQTALKNIDTVTVRANKTNLLKKKSIKETPISYNDIYRYLKAENGVTTGSDLSNDIVVYGYGPESHTWQIYGATITNPNHLTTAGTHSDLFSRNGGGMNIISGTLTQNAQWSSIGKSDIANISGGSIQTELQEARDSLMINLDLNLVGPEAQVHLPLNKNNKLLLNFRYATVKLLTTAGADFGDEDISYQDFFIHHTLKSRFGKTSLYHINGISYNLFSSSNDSIKAYRDLLEINYKGSFYLTGLHHKIKSKPLSFTFHHNLKQDERLQTNNQENRQSNFQFNKASFHFVGIWRPKLNQHHFLNIKLNPYHEEYNLNTPYNLNQRAQIFWLNTSINNEYYSKGHKFQLGLNLIQNNKGLNQILPYISWNKSFNKWIIGTSFSQKYQDYWMINSGLNFIPMNKFNLHINKNNTTVSYKTILFYDFTHKLPYSSNNQIALNETNGFFQPITFDIKVPFRSYGWSNSISKKWKNLACQIHATLYQSELLVQNIYRSSLYNYQYTGGLMISKSWGKKRKWKWIVQNQYRGGRPDFFYFNLENMNYQINEENNREDRLKPYHVIHFRIQHERARIKSKRKFYFELQNMLNSSNMAYQYYDPITKTMEAKYQLPMIPNLGYTWTW